MRKALFELPHRVTWLAGVARAAGFDDLDAVELCTDCTLLNGIDEHRVVSTMRAHEADVYLFSPMTINLPQALRIAKQVGLPQGSWRRGSRSTAMMAAEQRGTDAVPPDQSPATR